MSAPKNLFCQFESTSPTKDSKKRPYTTPQKLAEWDDDEPMKEVKSSEFLAPFVPPAPRKPKRMRRRLSTSPRASPNILNGPAWRNKKSSRCEIPPFSPVRFAVPDQTAFDSCVKTRVMLTPKLCPPTPLKLRTPESPCLFKKELLTRFCAESPPLHKFSTDFNFADLIGAGSFFDVYRTRMNSNSESYAVKKSRLPFKGSRDRGNYMREIEIMEQLGPNKNIVPHYNAWQEDGHLYVQMKLYDMSLAGFSSSLEFTERLVWNVLQDLSKALLHIHSQDVIHLDIKPANVMVSISSEDPCLTTYHLSDFGQAIRCGEWEDGGEGDARFLAPEILKFRHSLDKTESSTTPGSPTSAADICSLGLLLVELVTGVQLPGQGTLWHELRGGGVADFMSAHCTITADLKNVLISMLDPNPFKRPFAKELVKISAAHAPRS